MALEDLQVSMTAVAIAAELNRAMKDGSFAEIQRLLGELGYRIELRKPKKEKKFNNTKEILHG